MGTEEKTRASRPLPATARKMFEESWLTLTEEEQLEMRAAAKQTWLAAFNATKLVRAYCPDCKGKVMIEFPDTLNQAKTLEILSNLSFGEQPKQVQVDVNHGELTLKVLQEMSMGELLEIGAFQVDEYGAPILDAEFTELIEPAFELNDVAGLEVVDDKIVDAHDLPELPPAA